MNLKLKLLALATAAIGAAPLFAADTGEMVPTRVVSVAGLDLASPAGRSLARNRIARAVAEVCQADRTPELSQSGVIRRCRLQAIASAESQLVRFTARADAKGGIEVASLRR